MKRIPVLFLILLVALLSFEVVLKQSDATPMSNIAQTVPGVDGTLQMAYSEAIGSDNSTYHFQPSGAGYTASNPTHDL
ncbi:MAG: hypothetical protein L0154_25235, partial [Chloroflexi bacterium]|nr:hypothetical protein [Chloroflexota bacterium]